MNNINAHVVSILDDYIEINNHLFAILINSEWGTGKTWFIKNYFNSKNTYNKNRINLKFILSKIKNIFNKNSINIKFILSKIKRLCHNKWLIFDEK